MQPLGFSCVPLNKASPLCSRNEHKGLKGCDSDHNTFRSARHPGGLRRVVITAHIDAVAIASLAQQRRSVRMVAIVDAYDAKSHDRVYRAALDEVEAVARIEQGRGTQFDPFLVGVFFALLPEMRRIHRENPDERFHPADAPQAKASPRSSAPKRRVLLQN